MFLKSECNAKIDESVPIEDRFTLAQDIMKTREEGFKQLTRWQSEAFRLDAIDFRALKRKANEDKIDAKRQKKTEIKDAERDKILERGIPNHIGCARLSAEEKQDVCRRLATPHVQSLQVEQDKTIAESAPRPPSKEEQGTFDTIVARLARKPRQPPPWWCSWVCPNRDMYVDVAVARGSEDAKEYWLMLFAKQTPI